MDNEERDFLRMPGLYRIWDLQFVLERTGDWQVRYAELTEDGTPLFAIYRRSQNPGGVSE